MGFSSAQTTATAQSAKPPAAAPFPKISWNLSRQRSPVLFLTSETLARTKAGVERNDGPWKQSWQLVLRGCEEGVAASPEPYLGDDFVQMRYAALSQFRQAAALALRWRVSGETHCAGQAKRILLAWATCQPQVGTTPPVIPPADPPVKGKAWGNIPDIGLNFAYVATAFCHAYTMLYPALSAEEAASAEPWLRFLAAQIETNHRAWLDNDCYDRQYFNNHLSVHNMGLAALGFTLRDESLVRRAFEGPGRGYFDMLCGAVLLPEKGDEQFWYRDSRRGTLPGEIYDRYRVVTVRNGKGFGIPYSFLHLEALTYTAEMAFNNGADLYAYCGPHGESLRAAYRHLAPYLVTLDPAHYGDYHANDLLQPERRGLYEIAFRRLGGEASFGEVLRAGSRATDDAAILGPVSVLFYGEPGE